MARPLSAERGRGGKRASSAGQRYLTLSELVRSLEALGLEVSERTVRYYVRSGLIPKPLKDPFPGADARVRYYPRDAVLRIRRIREWQQAGYSLAQIKEFGESGPGPRPGQLENRGDWRRLVARRFLRGWYGQRRRMIEAEFVARVQSESSTWLLEEAGKERLREELGLLMEPEAARSLVDYAFFEMSDKERRVWRARFQRWRPKPPAPSDPERWSEAVLVGPYRRLLGDFLIGAVPPEALSAPLVRAREALVSILGELETLELPLAAALCDIVERLDLTLRRILEEVSGDAAPSVLLSELDRLSHTVRMLGPYHALLSLQLEPSSVQR